MKIKDLLFYGFAIVCIVVILAGIGFGIGAPLYNDYKLQQNFPVGSTITLKNFDIKGNIIKYEEGMVFVLVTDKNGQGQTFEVEKTLLSK